MIYTITIIVLFTISSSIADHHQKIMLNPSNPNPVTHPTQEKYKMLFAKLSVPGRR